MRVLIFSTAYLPFVGGAEIAVKEITDRIDDLEFDLITARMKRGLPKFERVGNVNVYRAGFGLGFLDKFLLPFVGCAKANKLHRKNNYDVAWSIMSSQASIAASFFKKKFPHTKLVLTLQEGDEEEHLKRYVFGINFLYKLLIKPWHVLVFKKADYITAISEYLKKRAKKNGAGCPIEIVPNAVDIELFSKEYSEDVLEDLKKNFGKKSDDKFIITTSRLVKKNAVGDIIEALKYLPENVKFLILGTGLLEKELRFQVSSFKFQDRVFFLGLINYEEIPKYLKISDVFVRPSLSEGMGSSFIEAMAAGVPVVGTPVGGIVDFLKEGETGLFCGVRSPKSIAEKVEMLLKDEELRSKIIATAKKMVFEKYNWDLVAKQMVEVFHKFYQPAD